MRYISTRGGGIPLTAGEAILTGLAPDGGLFVPEEIPAIPVTEELLRLPYHELAARVLGPWLTDYAREDVQRMTREAYAPGRFEEGRPAPLSDLGEDTRLLELYHGPTLAFKDLALQLLPRLMACAMKQNGKGEGVLVAAATSGDTGKAALEGFRDVEGTRVAVIYPRDGVSPAQRRQMVTQRGSNVWVRAIEGNFDDAQSAVKAFMGKDAIVSGLRDAGWRLSSANSINIGRLIPQIVYYFHAYAELFRRGEIVLGEKVDFSVPTGNFGDILAGYYAKRMGLPVGTLICASNRNSVLTDFFAGGTYDAGRPFYRTISPSMDILVSSNLERYLYERSGRDPGKIRGWMASLKAERRYSVDCLEALTDGLWAACADDDQTRAVIRDVWNETGRLIDPHTAVGLAARRAWKNTGAGAKCVVLSTASPYKFSSDVLGAIRPEENARDDREAARTLAAMAGERLPEAITELETLPELHTGSMLPGEVGEALVRWVQAGPVPGKGAFA